MFFPVVFGGCTKTFAGATLPATLQWWSVLHNGTLWVAVGDAVNTEIPCAYSTNGGATWSAGTGTDTAGFTSRAVAWNGTVWSVLDQSDGTLAMTSPDGQAWTQRVKSGGPVGGIENGSSYVGIDGTFYAVDAVGNRNLYSSTNGYTFSTQTNVLPAGAGDYCGICSNGTNAVVVSGYSAGPSSVAAYITNADLAFAASWTQTAMPSSSTWQHTIWTGRMFFATGAAGVGASSFDGGATWSAVTLPTATGGSPATKYGRPCATTSGKILLPVETVQDSTTANVIFMSCDDGQTWNNIALSQQGKWAASGCDGSAVVIVGTDTGSGSTKAEYAA